MDRALLLCALLSATELHVGAFRIQSHGHSFGSIRFFDGGGGIRSATNAHYGVVATSPSSLMSSRRKDTMQLFASTNNNSKQEEEKNHGDDKPKAKQQQQQPRKSSSTSVATGNNAAATGSTKKAPVSPPPINNSNNNNKGRSYTRSSKKNKEQLMQAVGEEMKKQQQKRNRNQQHQQEAQPQQAQQQKQQRESEEESSKRLLDQINPFKAGQSLRQALFRGADEMLRQSKYYLSNDDDEYDDYAMTLLLDSSTRRSNSASAAADAHFVSSQSAPEVLVVGATGATGQLIVRQLLLRQCRVRVLVRDLYTATLNKLGTSVTYCQGDLLKPDTLEYATTDVDKIVFCAGAPAHLFHHQKKNAEMDQDDDTAAVAAAAAVHHFAAIDEIGMKNLVHAYQNVRHADYGTQQAAKRVLFRFVNRIEDFYLFNIDVERSEKARWMRNKFGLGVFYGWGPAYLQSSRFQRSRDEPAYGIDFAPSFAGFICCLCADGESFEAVIVANGDEYEYTCSFSTRSKSPASGTNSSRSKFMSLRLPFENFTCQTDPTAPPFVGRDIRYIGFRYNGRSGQRFYLSMDWIKLYRSQPEPEFVYLSDARIPRVVKHSMVQTEAKQLAIHNEIRLYDDQQMRQPEATFYKFVGEEIVKKSGLAYSIVRVHGLTDGAAADASAISLLATPPLSEAPVSRADVAQICVQALLDPAALNKSFYVTPSNRPTTDDISRKLSLLPVDEVP
jgi:uncharacterized protein YbjT (DUF2867 family)